MSFQMHRRAYAIPYFFVYKIEFIPFQNNSINLDLSYRTLFRKGKTSIIAKFHRTDLVICSHSRGENPVLWSNKYSIPGIVVKSM